VRATTAWLGGNPGPESENISPFETVGHDKISAVEFAGSPTGDTHTSNITIIDTSSTHLGTSLGLLIILNRAQNDTSQIVTAVSIGRLAQIPRLVAPLVWMDSQLHPMTSIDAAGIGREAVGRVVHHQRSITIHHWSDLTLRVTPPRFGVCHAASWRRAAGSNRESGYFWHVSGAWARLSRLRGTLEVRVCCARLQLRSFNDKFKTNPHDVIRAISRNLRDVAIRLLDFV